MLVWTALVWWQGIVVAGETNQQNTESSIGRAIVNAAPKLMQHMKQKGYRNIGVLKFLAKLEEEQIIRSSLGTLNSTMANRLERALALEMEVDNPFGLVRSASEVAAAAGADYDTNIGRKLLFAERYPLAAGSGLVNVNAFLTGLVKISRDRRLLTVHFRVVDKDGIRNVLQPVNVFNSPGLLSEMGESFRAIDFKQLQKRNPNKQLTPDQQEKEIKKRTDSIFASFAKRKKTAGGANPVEFEAHPLALPDIPVRLEIFQDNKRIGFNFKEGKAFLKEFQEKPVLFRLTHDGSKNTYGIVLKVNGINSLGMQSRPDELSRKWVMSPEDKQYVLRGFQLDNGKAKPFLVVSPKIARQRGMIFTKDTGTITMTVFAERRSKKPGSKSLPVVQEIQKLQKTEVVEQGTELPPAANFDRLQSQLLKVANRSRGGLIMPDAETIASGVRIVRFEAESIPVMSATIIYFDLDKGKKP